jgi:hypothetical protein
VNVQLIDAGSGKHLWADRFEKPVADLFDMQDAIVSRLAHTLGDQLVVAEARRAERSLHPDAMDLTFQGHACLYKGTDPEHLTHARGFFERALAIDHRTVGALVGIAVADLRMGASLLTDVRAARFSAAETNVVKALSLAPDHALAHWTMVWGVSTFLQTVPPKALLNASTHYCLIATWPALTALLVWPNILWVSLPRPKAIYSRLSVSRLAI